MRLYIADIAHGLHSQFFFTEQEAIAFCDGWQGNQGWDREVWTWDFGQNYEEAVERNIVYRWQHPPQQPEDNFDQHFEDEDF